jgi:pilus assembly protein Flp/PilA
MELLTSLITVVFSRPRDDRGATAVEYGLMVALIAIVIIGAVGTFGTNVSELFEIPAGAL